MTANPGQGWVRLPNVEIQGSEMLRASGFSDGPVVAPVPRLQMGRIDLSLVLWACDRASHTLLCECVVKLASCVNQHRGNRLPNTPGQKGRLPSTEG